MRLIPLVWTTDRLRIRRFALPDAEFVLELHSHPNLVRFIPTAAMTTLADAHAWIASSNRGPGRGWWCVELLDGTPVAAILLAAVPPSAGVESDDVEIGWRAHPAHTGHGYVTEAAAVVLDSALRSGLPRVVAVVDPANEASRRVAERLGMVDRGRTDDFYDQTLDLFVADA